MKLTLNVWRRGPLGPAEGACRPKTSATECGSRLCRYAAVTLLAAPGAITSLTTALHLLDSSLLSSPALFDAAARVTAPVGGVRPVPEDEHAPCEVKAAPPQEERSDAGVQPARTLGTRGDAW